MAKAKTMYWQVVPGIVLISVNTDVPPSDEDWDGYLEDVAREINNIKGVLVYSEAVGPSATQRARVDEASQQHDVELKTAIMTGSRLVRGVVTALNWAQGGKVKAFPTTGFQEAVDYLELDDEEKVKTKVTLKLLARAANVTIEAFADESGQFRRKYDS